MSRRRAEPAEEHKPTIHEAVAEAAELARDFEAAAADAAAALEAAKVALAAALDSDDVGRVRHGQAELALAQHRLTKATDMAKQASANHFQAMRTELDQRLRLVGRRGWEVRHAAGLEKIRAAMSVLARAVHEVAGNLDAELVELNSNLEELTREAADLGMPAPEPMSLWRAGREIAGTIALHAPHDAIGAAMWGYHDVHLRRFRDALWARLEAEVYEREGETISSRIERCRAALDAMRRGEHRWNGVPLVQQEIDECREHADTVATRRIEEAAEKARRAIEAADEKRRARTGLQSYSEAFSSPPYVF